MSNQATQAIVRDQALSAEATKVDVRRTLAVVIADLRASGDTGMVENLLDADAAIAELISASKFLLPRIRETNGAACVDRMEAALARVGGAK